MRNTVDIFRNSLTIGSGIVALSILGYAMLILQERGMGYYVNEFTSDDLVIAS